MLTPGLECQIVLRVDSRDLYRRLKFEAGHGRGTKTDVSSVIILISNLQKSHLSQTMVRSYRSVITNPTSFPDIRNDTQKVVSQKSDLRNLQHGSFDIQKSFFWNPKSFWIHHSDIWMDMLWRFALATQIQITHLHISKVYSVKITEHLVDLWCVL